jgi:hypothetical protein
MLGSWVLEVAIGLIFVFLLFSTICAALREGIEAWTKTRAAYLERGVRELLHDVDGEELAKQFYEHPLIHSLSSAPAYKPGAEGSQKIEESKRGKLGKLTGGGNLPSYIPTGNFAAAMIDIAARGPLPRLTEGSTKDDPALFTGPVTAESLRAGIAKMENKRVARALLNALDLAKDDLDKTRLNLEAWYDAGMDRVSGWYKRSTQWIVFWIAFVMAIVLNVDAIGIANFLYQNDNARHAVVAQAEAAVAEVRARDASARVADTAKKLEELKTPQPETTKEGHQAIPPSPEELKKAEDAAAAARTDEQAALAQLAVARERAAAARAATTAGGTPPPAGTGAPGGKAAQDTLAQTGSAPTSGQQYTLARMELDAPDLPIGWRRDMLECPSSKNGWQCGGSAVLTLVGWLLTALAATLGAPFWFDTLNKVMVIRSTVKPHEKSKAEGSEDRPNKPPTQTR